MIYRRRKRASDADGRAETALGAAQMRTRDPGPAENTHHSRRVYPRRAHILVPVVRGLSSVTASGARSLGGAAPSSTRRAPFTVDERPEAEEPHDEAPPPGGGGGMAGAAPPSRPTAAPPSKASSSKQQRVFKHEPRRTQTSVSVDGRFFVLLRRWRTRHRSSSALKCACRSALHFPGTSRSRTCSSSARSSSSSDAVQGATSRGRFVRYHNARPAGPGNMFSCSMRASWTKGGTGALGGGLLAGCRWPFHL